MGACVSTSTNADDDVKQRTRKQTKSSSSVRGRSFSSSPETRFSRSGSSSSSPCHSVSPRSPSLVRQRLAPLETDFKKPAKKTLSSSLLLQVRSLTGSPEPTSRPVVRRIVRRTRSLCTTECHVASNDSNDNNEEGQLPGRRRSAGDIPANITQEVLQILTGKGAGGGGEGGEGDKTGVQIEPTCENFVKDSIRVDETLGAGVMAGKEEESGTEEDGPCVKDSGCNRNVSQTHGDNIDSSDVEHTLSVDWHYPIVEEIPGLGFSSNHTHSLDLGRLDSSKRETVHDEVHEKKRQEVEDDEDEIVIAEHSNIGWPLLAIGRANDTNPSKLVPENTASLGQFSDTDKSRNEVSAAGLETAPESFLEVNVERIYAAERMKNLSVEMEAFLEDVRKTSIRKANVSETETTSEQKIKTETGISSESSIAILGKSIPVSPRTSPRKPASPKASRPPKPKPSVNIFGKGKNPVDKFFIGTSLFDLGAFIDEENDLEKDENEDVAVFDPALLATFEEAFQQYSKEDWMDASKNESPRRRSLEVWAKAVAKASSLKEDKQMNESGSWDAIAVGENSFSPTSVLSSSSSFTSTSSCSSNHCPKKIVSRDVWASEEEAEVSSKSPENNSNRYVEEDRDAKERSDMLAKEDLRLSDSSTIDITAVFDRFLSVHPESTNMGFFDSSLSKSSSSTRITA